MKIFRKMFRWINFVGKKKVFFFQFRFTETIGIDFFGEVETIHLKNIRTCYEYFSINSYRRCWMN